VTQDDRLSNSNSFDKPTPPRVLLGLKVGAKSLARKDRTPAVVQLRNKAEFKPGARWSDEYMQRMQADMDALRRD
jgi:hypothetical protein